MDPLSIALLVGGGIGAASSLISAITSYVLKRRKGDVKIKIGDKEVTISGARDADLRRAVDQLQQELRSRTGETKSGPA